MKVKSSAKLRCKDCYFVTREGVLRVQCRTNARHKQTRSATAKRKRA